jgi:hypothetical protein
MDTHGPNQPQGADRSSDPVDERAGQRPGDANDPPARRLRLSTSMAMVAVALLITTVADLDLFEPPMLVTTVGLLMLAVSEGSPMRARASWAIAAFGASGLPLAIAATVGPVRAFALVAYVAVHSAALLALFIAGALAFKAPGRGGRR